MRRRRGFSLLECVLVCAVIGLLAALAFPAFGSALRSAREARAVASLRTLAAAQATFYASEGRFALPGELIRNGCLAPDALARSGSTSGPPSATETLSDDAYEYSARFALGSTGVTLDADPLPGRRATHRRFRLRLGRVSAGRGGGESLVLVAPPSEASPPARAYRPLGG